MLRWLTLGLIVKSFVPAAWLGFSLTYSRGDYRESLARWRIPLAIVALLPIGLSLGFREQLLQVVPAGPAGEELQLRFGADRPRSLNVILLVALVLDPDEPGTDVPIGGRNDALADQVRGPGPGGDLRRPPLRPEPGILFPRTTWRWSGVESSALLIGCLFLALAYARTGFAEIDVYPSRAVLRSSLTVLIVRRLPLHRRRPGPDRQALWRSGEFPVPGLRRAPGNGRPGGAAAFRPPPAAHSRFRRPPFHEGPARFRPDLDRVLAAAGQRQGSSRPLRGVREVGFRDLRGAVGDRLAAGRAEGAAHRRRLDRAAARRMPPPATAPAAASSAVAAGTAGEVRRRSTWKR